MNPLLQIHRAARALALCSCKQSRRLVMMLAALISFSCGMQAQTGPVVTGVLVNGVASTSGPVGASLIIQGSGFGSAIGFSTVTLNGIALAGNGVKPTSWSPSNIVVVIPKTASSGPLIVKVSGKLSNAVNFTIGAVVTGVSPATALVGSSVTITGNGFGTAGGTVTFNGTLATASGWTDASIVAQVPNGATAGPIVVTVNGQVSNGIAFTPTPSITSLSPNFGLSGASITIAGNSFGIQSSAGTVTFNGVAAAVTTWSNTSIAVTAPSGALTGNVVVTVNGVSSAGQTFTYTPQISGISPSPALADSPVTIQGNNFGAQQATITFNGIAAAVSSWNNTSITATVPGNATPGPVVVTVNGVASNGIAFSLPALYSFHVTYAPDGDVLSATDNVNGNWTYTYDDFNRLVTASNNSPAQGFSYVYDQYGNRWQQNLTAGSGGTSLLTFTGSPNASTTGNCYHAAGRTNQPDGYCFDAAGNLLNDGQHSYTYDAENRIIAVDGGQTATYNYDAAGSRIQKVNTGGTSASYLHDLSGHVITELDGTGAWTRGEVYAGGRHLGTYANGIGGTTYLAQADWLGTERTRVLPSGDLFETCVSLPFGDGLNCTGSADPSPDHFTGKERDAESALDYFGARYYSSAMGRFITPDWAANATAVPYASFNNPQSLNLYSYVGNNPTNLRDYDGHSWFTDQFKKAGIGVLKGLGFIATAPTPDPAPKPQVRTHTTGERIQEETDKAVQELSPPEIVIPHGATEKVAFGLTIGAVLLSDTEEEVAEAGALLRRSLASEAQAAELLAGKGQVIAGPGAQKALKAAPRLAAEYGGAPTDWVKITSSHFTPPGSDGAQTGFATHAYQNVKTGQMVEMKTVPDPLHNMPDPPPTRPVRNW
jgi:RHS repeat-associated protein